MIEHYEFCIDILVIINADDKLLIKEMSKKASCITISTSVHCTLSANKEKAEKKKKDLCGYYQVYFYCKCVLHEHIFIYLNCRKYVPSLFKKTIKSAKRQNL